MLDLRREMLDLGQIMRTKSKLKSKSKLKLKLKTKLKVGETLVMCPSLI